MELLLEPTFFCFSTISSSSSSKVSFSGNVSGFRNLCFRRSKLRNLGLSLKACDRTSQCDWDSNAVEVIAIGSSKEALLDFCLQASFNFSPVRFWTVHMRDSIKMQLLQRSIGTDMLLKDVEVPLLMQSCPRAVILVASAGYGTDYTTALEFLTAVKSVKGFPFAIVMKPFGFEGQRRQNEVEDLGNMLREHKFFSIVVDTDALLKKEVVTLAEALRSAHAAVMLAICSISTLLSDVHPKFVDPPHDGCKEMNTSEVLTLLESYKEAEVGYGASSNIKSSIIQAIFDCPFLTGDLKELKGVVICNVLSATAMDNSDVHSFMRVFRKTTGFTREIIFSSIHEPALEPNLIVTTVLVLGCRENKISPKKSFLSNLASHFPFLSQLWGRGPQPSEDNSPAKSHGDPYPSEDLTIPNGGNLPISSPSDGDDGNLDVCYEELETLLSDDHQGISSLRKSSAETKGSEVGAPFASSDSDSSHYDQSVVGVPSFQREPLNSWSAAQHWARESIASDGFTANGNKLNHHVLQVGVKPSEQSNDPRLFTNSTLPANFTNLDDASGEIFDGANVSWDALTDAGYDTLQEFCNAASSLLKGKYADSGSRKQGVLSARAASMLEAERDLEKKWTPVLEMKYRGGIYKGQCRGGLPEGKGRLTLKDGSFYEGTWRFGKRSSLGTFCYSNGDVFQGSWRDDLMHGKGWFYFHNGDRWFANFWKGKANGEGRFYSKRGGVFFGQFQGGWRHGPCLSIDIDGTRWNEVWDEGVLVSRDKLDVEETGLRS